MTRDDWKRAEAVLHKPDVALAMRARCEEQGHDWENCCTILLQLYEQCKWCGEKR